MQNEQNFSTEEERAWGPTQRGFEPEEGAFPEPGGFPNPNAFPEPGGFPDPNAFPEVDGVLGAKRSRIRGGKFGGANKNWGPDAQALRWQDYVWFFLLFFSLVEPFCDISRFPIKSVLCVLTALLAFGCVAMCRFSASFERAKIGWAALLVYFIGSAFVANTLDTTYTVINMVVLLAFTVKPSVSATYILQRWLVALGVVLTASCVLHAVAPSVLYRVGGIFANAEWLEVANRWASHDVYSGLTNQTGTTAILIVLGIVALLCSMERSKSPARCYGLLGLMALGVILTGKRAMFILAVFSALYYWNATGSRKKKVFTTIVLVLGSFAYLAFSGGGPDLSEVKVYERFAGTNVGAGGYYSNRDVLFRAAWATGAENPIFGVGWGKFAQTSGLDMGAHNVYLQIWAECGLVGLVPFLALTLGTFFYTRQRLKIVDGVEKKLLLFSFINQAVFLLYSFTGNPWYTMSTRNVYLFACMIALTASTFEPRRRDEGRMVA